MKQWLHWAPLITVSWVGAFAIAFAVTEWRNDDGQHVPSVTATLEPSGSSSELTPAPTPETVRVEFAVGTAVDWQGLRLTLDEVNSEIGLSQFTVENIDATPERIGQLTYPPRVVSREGFVCFSNTYSDERWPLPGYPGEKGKFYYQWHCEGTPPKTLTLGGGSIVFEYPE